MTTSRLPRPSGLFLVRPLQALALGSILLTGCVTVRAPAGQIADPVPVRGGRAEPQAMVWLESGKPISPAEQAQAHAAATAALDLALANRPPLTGDPLVVVREQGVTRTGSRRSDQHAAVAGMVVGAVAVAAAVAVVATHGHGHGGPPAAAKSSQHASQPMAQAAPRAAAPPRVPAPRAAPTGLHPPVPRAPPVPAPRIPPAAPHYPAVPAPGYYPAYPGHPVGWTTTVAFGFSFDLQPVTTIAAAPVAPYPPPEEGAPAPDQAPYPAPYPYAPGPDEPPPDAWAPPDQVVPVPVAAVTLAPLAPLPVSERGFFDGDVLELDVTLVDPYSGEPLWWKQLRKEADPLDPQAVRAAMDELLKDGGWMPPPRPSVPPPAGPAPGS